MMDEKEPRFTLDVPVSLPENITDCKLVSELELWLIPYHLMELELVGKFRTWVIPNDDELYPNGRDKLVVLPLVNERTVDYEKRIDIDDSGFVVRFQDLKSLLKENEKLKQELQNYEQLIVNSYVGEEETLDGFVGKYVIWEDELQKYKNKNEMIDNE